MFAHLNVDLTHRFWGHFSRISSVNTSGGDHYSIVFRVDPSQKRANIDMNGDWSGILSSIGNNHAPGTNQRTTVTLQLGHQFMEAIKIHEMGVSTNGSIPKSSILMGFSWDEWNNHAPSRSEVSVLGPFSYLAANLMPWTLNLSMLQIPPMSCQMGMISCWVTRTITRIHSHSYLDLMLRSCKITTSLIVVAIELLPFSPYLLLKAMQKPFTRKKTFQQLSSILTHRSVNTS